MKYSSQSGEGHKVLPYITTSTLHFEHSEITISVYCNIIFPHMKSPGPLDVIGVSERKLLRIYVNFSGLKNMIPLIFPPRSDETCAKDAFPSHLENQNLLNDFPNTQFLSNHNIQSVYLSVLCTSPKS